MKRLFVTVRGEAPFPPVPIYRGASGKQSVEIVKIVKGKEVRKVKMLSSAGSANRKQ